MKKKAIMGVVGMILLAVICVMEYSIGFNLLRDKIESDNDFYSAYASDFGAASVTIEEIYVYDEAPVPDETGEVIALKDFGINVKVDGTITDRSFLSYGYITYADTVGGNPTRLTFNRVTSKLDEWNDAYNKYMNGHPEDLLLCYGVREEDSSNTYYQQSTQDGRSAVVYNEQNSMYYEFVKQEDCYIVLTSGFPFSLTKESATSEFGDPSKNPMYSHAYSNYEVLAAANTRREQLEKDEEEDDSPYVSGGVVGTTDTYTSTADNNKRRQLASYTDYTWKADGSSDDTTMLVDISSAEAKASEWVLTETEYGYQSNGLSLYGLSGSRSTTNMSISGTVANTVEAERPYIIVVKFLNDKGELLTLVVVDNRSKPLGAASTANAVQQFTAQITSDNCNVQDVTSVMFEMY